MTILLAAVFFSGNCGVTPLEGSSVKFPGGDDGQCRVLVGMKFMEEEELKDATID